MECRTSRKVWAGSDLPVVLNPRPQSARAEGTADIHVKTRLQPYVTESPDVQRAGFVALQHEHVVTGLRGHGRNLNRVSVRNNDNITVRGRIIASWPV